MLTLSPVSLTPTRQDSEGRYNLATEKNWLNSTYFTCNNTALSGALAVFCLLSATVNARRLGIRVTAFPLTYSDTV